MAPKRAAKKAAPAPPPPPPPDESSDETRSGSRSDESEDEEAIAESPVPAATKNTPAPAQQGDESESSDEEEEEEEPARAAAAAATAPKNQAPPPQKKEDSDDEEDDEEEEEEEEEEEPTRAAPPSAPKKRPPEPPRRGEDSDASDDGESDEEAPPPPKPASKKEAAAVKPPAPAAAADEAKKPAAFHRIWSTDDEVRILEALAAHQKQHGTSPQPDALIDVLAGKLDNPAYGSKELQSKVKSLKNRYVTLSKRGEVPGKEHDRRVLDLSKIVWDGDKTTTTAANNGLEQKGFDEMCELYPYLAEEVKELEARRPGMCKREFGKMDDDKACAMDEKIKKQRVLQIRVEMRRADLTKEVTKALVDLVDG